MSKGRGNGERRLLFRMGMRKLGPPTPAVLARLNAIADAAQVEQLCIALLDVSTWDELLAAPRTARKRRR